MSFTVTEQVRLLKRCVSRNLDLDKQLAKLGLSYDHLRYRGADLAGELFDGRDVSPGTAQIDDCQCSPNNIPAISFFAGCGGMDLGFEYAGFDNVAAIELNETFCRTLVQNRYKGFVIGPPEYSGDARNRDEITDLLRKQLGLKKGGFPGVFHGGPPCHPFSIAANQRFSKNGANFKRIGFANSDYGTLLFDYVFYIRVFRPAVFLMENVAGLLTVDDGEQLSTALSQLQASGYRITEPGVLNAADYQVPQNRFRVFIVGHRRPQDTFAFPPPIPPKLACDTILQKPIAGAPNHVTRKHRAESILRYMQLNFGERDQLGRVDRLDPRLPSKTVIAGGSRGGGRSHLHPYIPRTLSVREGARLQTFPDSYAFVGSPARQFTQVGNAVPPLLAFHLAVAIYQQLFHK